MIEISISEYENRIVKLQKFLADKNIDAALLTQNSDIYYYSGSAEPLYLLIPVCGKPSLLARKAIARIRKEVNHIELFEFYNTADLLNIFEMSGLINADKIAFTFDTVTFQTVERLKKIFNCSSVVDISTDIRMMRMCKSETELNIQIKAGEIAGGLPEIIKSKFRYGMTELELSVEIEKYFRLNGGSNVIRCRKENIECIGVCSSGKNSLSGTKFDGICSGAGVSKAAPYGANCDVIMEKTPVIIDFGFSYNGYIVDITRMFSYGKVSENIMKAYNAMLDIEKKLIDIIRPGVSWEYAYETALSMAVSAGYEKEFMGLGSEKVRFVGHGVGLELDEPPFIAPKMKNVFMENMVIALEPKVALPDIGVIGIENTYIIRENSCQLLTVCSNDFICL